MKAFLDEDFLLSTETSREIYAEVEKDPIIDFHNHLNVSEIYEDRRFDSITDLWLGGDHYKWRAMRTQGVPEKLVTGPADPYARFEAWADTVENAIGNPLYHWTHLELQRYFDIHTPLSKKTARSIYDEVNEKLTKKEYSVRNLLLRQRCEILCTTDDPADDLSIHAKLAESDFPVRVLPTFRPDKAVGIEKPGFREYVQHLGDVVGGRLESFPDLLEALTQRLDFFVAHGARVTDISLENRFFVPAAADEVDAIYRDAMKGKAIDETDMGKYHGWILKELGRLYAARGMAMQLHIGALRGVSSRMQRRLGADTGFDSVNDFSYAEDLGALLDSMDQTDELPRTVLYYVNVKDANMLAAMAGDFQSNEQGIRGKVQLGPAWWFADHRDGMEQQMRCLCNAGLLSGFIGMLTDSRSFLSFPRHEYFRRILCDLVGRWVENGEYPKDMTYLTEMLHNICGRNAKEYFGFAK